MRTLIKAFAFTALILASGIAFSGTVTKSLKRKDKSLLTYYFTSPEGTAKFPIIVQVHGSGCGSRWPEHNSLLPMIGRHMNAALVTVEKRFMVPGVTDCPEAYVRKYTFSERVDDVLQVVKSLKKEKRWNGSIALYGVSEGAIASAVMSANVKNLKAVILLSGGGGYSMANNLRILVNGNRFACDGVFNLDQLERKFTDILKDPSFYKSWCYPAMTHAWWKSFLTPEPLHSLKLAKTAAVFIAHGTADTTIPVEGAREAELQLRGQGRNVTAQYYDGYGHGMHDKYGVGHWNEVAEEAITWLSKQM